MSVPENRLSLHPSIVGWRMAWPALGQLAAEIGYTGAVIPREQPLPAQANSAVRATAMQLPAEVRKDEATFLHTLPTLKPACAFAAEAGCRVALLGVPPSAEQPKELQAKVYQERLKTCCAVLDAHSIRLALECITPLHMRHAHAYEFIWRNEEMLEFGLSISSHCGLVIDSWHWHHAGGQPNWFRSIPPDRILDVHISDSGAAPPEAIRDSERLLPGEGVVDFKLFADLLVEQNYGGPYTVEVFGRGLSEMEPHKAARLAFEASSATLKKARRDAPFEENATVRGSAEA